MPRIENHYFDRFLLRKMSLVEAFEASDFPLLESILVGAKQLLQKAVESGNSRAAKVLIDAGFSFLPEETKYPVDQEILNLVKPLSKGHQTFIDAVSKLEDVSLCPYDNQKFLENIFEEKDWKKIDYYLWKVAWFYENKDDDERFYQYGTLELIEKVNSGFSQQEKESFYRLYIHCAERNERDCRIYTEALRYPISRTPDPVTMSIICLEVFVKHPFFNLNYHILAHFCKELERRVEWWRLRKFNNTLDTPVRVLTFADALGDRFTAEVKREFPKLHLFVERLRKITRKYAYIWFNKWHIKSADPNGNGLLFRKWKETIPREYVKN